MSSTSPLKLRAWQEQALAKYRASNAQDFLLVATPGAGKTTFALQIAHELFAKKRINRITVVAPTEHLKRQWADAAARFGIPIDPHFKNADGRHGFEYVGVALTYAQVASKPALHRARTEAAKTLVILDEIHHAGDALSWGDAVREAFDPALRRLSLTGTPFRSDSSEIPFVEYLDDGTGLKTSQSDFSYGYGDALRDSVVRPVIFLSYSGHMQWRTSAGDEISATLGEPLTKDLTAQAWRTALNPSGDWIPAVLQAANRRLSEMRQSIPDAGGLLIASDQDSARAYAKTLREVTGDHPVVVLSDDDSASERIEEFAKGNQRWMIAVRMVSEGVDVPRLTVGVYATSAATPLFFAQVVGRFVRARRRGETASIFLPSVPHLLDLASKLEMQRDHVLGKSASEQDESEEEALFRQAQQAEPTLQGQATLFEALGSQASFDRVLFDGGEFGTGAEVGSEEEADYLGIPGLLDADQVSALLRERQASQLASAQSKKSSGATAVSNAAKTSDVTDFRMHKELRSELSSLVAAWSHRSGKPHGVIHNELRDITGGAAVAQATSEQLQQRIDVLRRWFVGKK